MKNIFLLSAMVILSACASPQVTVTSTPLPTDTPTPTLTPTPVAIDGIAQDSEGNFLFYQEESQTWTILPKLDAEFDRIVTKDDGSVVAVDANGVEVFKLSISGEWEVVEKYSLGVDNVAFLEMREQQILEKWGYATWEELVAEKLLNSEEWTNHYEDANVPPVHKFQNEAGEVVLPYGYSFSQVFIAEQKWEDVSKDPFWTHLGVNAVELAYGVANEADNPVPILLRVKMNEGSEVVSIVPWLYSENGKTKTVGADGAFVDLEGRVLMLRVPTSFQYGNEKSIGYMNRLGELGGDDDFTMSHQSQFADRSLTERQLFEVIVTDEGGPLNLLQRWVETNGIKGKPMELASGGKAAAAYVFFVSEQAKAPYFLLADMIIDDMAFFNYTP